MIRIVKVGAPLTKGVHREYCGRAGKGEAGLLGNPFAVNVTHSNRDEVCDKFQVHFDMMIKACEGSLYRRMRELYKIALTQDVELACFCVPKRCHCETIKNFLDLKLGERNGDK
jgi:hypothetical protein